MGAPPHRPQGAWGFQNEPNLRPRRAMASFQELQEWRAGCMAASGLQKETICDHFWGCFLGAILDVPRHFLRQHVFDFWFALPISHTGSNISEKESFELYSGRGV